MWDGQYIANQMQLLVVGQEFKGAFTPGVRDSSFESPNTMLVI